MTTRVIPATPDAFAPYGTVVNLPTDDPTAIGDTFRYWSDVASYNIAGETEIGLCTVVAQPVPTVSGVERHMLTPEILIPADGPFDLPVLLDGAPDEELRVFRFTQGQALIINTGVWHGACLPVDAAERTYFVIFRRGTPHEDVVKKPVGPVGVRE